MLALETRASSSVGVAISVTTIPASAYLGVAAGAFEGSNAVGAVLVLGVNVAMLVVGGCGLLLVQQRVGRRDAPAAVGGSASPVGGRFIARTVSRVRGGARLLTACRRTPLPAAAGRWQARPRDVRPSD